MTDFLKANPYYTKEQYMWELTIPQIRLASYDFTHVRYLSEKEADKKKGKVKTFDSPDDFMAALGMTTI